MSLESAKTVGTCFSTQAPLRMQSRKGKQVKTKKPSNKSASRELLTLEVADWGPISYGRIALRPLTIFLGPNNSGKSQLARLIYSIAKVGESRPESFVLPDYPPKAVKDWFHQQTARGVKIRFNDSPTSVRAYFSEALSKCVREWVERLSLIIERNFGAPLDELKSKKSAAAFGLVISQHGDKLRLRLKLNRRKFEVDSWGCAFPNYEFDFTETAGTQGQSDFNAITEKALSVFTESIFQPIVSRAYYLPDIRSAGMDSYIQSSVLNSHSLMTGSWSGIISDYLWSMIRIARGNCTKREPRSRISQVASFLESQVARCKVDVAANDASSQRRLVAFNVGEFPACQAASSINEIAPLILFLKYIVRKGDLLVIEEPEAGLHPEAQRMLARAIMRLIRSGVRVLITTHAGNLLLQLYNFILLGQVTGKKRADFGYGRDEYLRQNELGAYLFYFDEKPPAQALVRELQFDKETRLPEDPFSSVSDEIIRETMQLLDRVGVSVSP